MSAQKRIMIVEDHPIFRKGLAQLINEEADLRVIAEADDVFAARQALMRELPDLVVVDITLKDASGIELIKYCADRYPDLPLLVLSMHDESAYAERVIRAGARGYIMKQEMTAHVIQAIRQVLSGNIYASDAVVTALLGKRGGGAASEAHNPVAELSDREFEIFTLIGKGFERSDIARLLNLSVKTVGTYREKIKEKLGLKTSAELMRASFDWLREHGE